ASVTAGQDYDVALTFGTRGLELWLNGSRVDTNSYTGGLGTNSGGIGNYEPIVLGASQSGSGNQVADSLQHYFTGTLKDVRLFDQQLDGANISQLSTQVPLNANAVFEDLIDPAFHEPLTTGNDNTVLSSSSLPNGAIVRNSKAYLMTESSQTWEEAQAEAQTYGGNLVAINDEAEQDWLSQTFGSTEKFWIGLTDATKEGEFRWVTGEPVTYTNWSPGQADNGHGNEDHVEMNFHQGKWNDQGAQSQRRGIIEIDLQALNNNDSLVGGAGNDVLTGGKGNDVLNGTSSLAKGVFEKDTLIGGAGSDYFILGDSNTAYYSSKSSADYATIQDFDLSVDKLQLYGVSSSYREVQVGSDRHLFYDHGSSSDLIAVFKNTDTLDLGSSSVDYV
ncbi:MAG: lectin-like protein, partial [Cyanobacteria bacterium P01_A01_bin.37]